MANEPKSAPQQGDQNNDKKQQEGSETTPSQGGDQTPKPRPIRDWASI